MGHQGPHCGGIGLRPRFLQRLRQEFAKMPSLPLNYFVKAKDFLPMTGWL